MILISRTYERYESHEPEEDICESDESGFRYQDKPYTFRELIDALRHGEPSSWPSRGDVRDWVTHRDTNDGTRDFYESGARESESVHYSRANPDRNAKWWRLAFRVAGLIRS
jgi:hypothetical protein